MADVGIRLEADNLVLWRGRDFRWAFQNLDDNGDPLDFPAGELYFEVQTDPITEWDFTIVDDTATIKVESEDADDIPGGTPWQLVFLPDGESSGGDPVGRGTVVRVG